MNSAQAQLPPVPVPPQNPITEAKRVLGKVLFWDEQLSSTGTVACGTCHQPFQATSDQRFAVHPGFDGINGTPDDIFGSLGVARSDALGNPVADALFGFDVQVTSRSAQPVFGALWAPNGFWDGRATSTFVDPESGAVSIPVGGALESQAVGPIVSDVEMAHENRDWAVVAAELIAAQPLALATYLPPDLDAALAGGMTYPALFDAAFGDPDITAQRIAFAIATYERTLVPDQTPFDLGTLTPQQQQGLNVFQNPGSRCAVCHQPPLFTDNSFRNIGVRPIAEDSGRQGVTGNPADGGRFKVPSLRNVGLRSNFMHTGRKTSLQQVVNFYLGIGGEMQFPQNQDPLIPGIQIPPGPPRNDLIAFLRDGLTDPRVEQETFPFDRPILRSEQGDADRNGTVDGADFLAFASCFGSMEGTVVSPGCERLDGDGDGVMTCADWDAFLAAWSVADPAPDFLLCAAVSDCVAAAQCCDATDDGVRDDACVWCECDAGTCVSVEVSVGDVGGAFGGCSTDGFVNVHDRNHVLTCFGGSNPCGAINMDVGGPFGGCGPDGFCNVHDVNHVLNAFAGVNTCTCGPAPDSLPAPAAGRATLSLRADRSGIAAGDAIEVRVLLGEAQADLQSYQLHLRVTGGVRGALELVDIRIDEHSDVALPEDSGRFEAFNLDRQQMLAGSTSGGVITRAGAYLATFVYRATDSARGEFLIDLAAVDGVGAQNALVADFGSEIAIAHSEPLIVQVGPAAASKHGVGRRRVDSARGRP